MEDYSEGRAEDDAQKAESREDEKVEFARDIAVVDEEDSSSSSSSSAEEEKLVSESPSVEVSEMTPESSRDVEPGDSDVAELDAAVSPILTEQAPQDIEPGDSDVAGLDAADSPILTEQATRDSSEVLLTDVGLKETDEETTLPPALDTTNDSSVDGVLVASANKAENSSGVPESNVEGSLQAADVPVVETGDAGDAEVVDTPDIDESMENQSQPTVSVRGRLPRPTSCTSCCGLFEALWR